MPIIEIPLAEVRDWNTFHATFATALGFPAFYGQNMSAWIDCLTYADEDDGMRSVVVAAGDVLTLSLIDLKDFRNRCPKQCEALFDATASVNYRRIESGDRPILALSYAQ